MAQAVGFGLTKMMFFSSTHPIYKFTINPIGILHHEIGLIYNSLTPFYELYRPTLCSWGLPGVRFTRQFLIKLSCLNGRRSLTRGLHVVLIVFPYSRSVQGEVMVFVVEQGQQ
ncbi:hypothetical protein DMENIID0001_013940 [Sergentomyia squamirostris]